MQQGSDVTHPKKDSQKLKLGFYICVKVLDSYILKGTSILINI